MVAALALGCETAPRPAAASAPPNTGTSTGTGTPNPNPSTTSTPGISVGDGIPVDVTPSATSEACPASGLTLWAEQTEAAMGLRVMSIALANCDTRAHTLDGYPTVRVLDQDHRPLDIQVGTGKAFIDSIALIESLDATPHRLTLQPGRQARARLVWRNTVDDITRSAANGSYLDISPTTGTDRQLVRPDGPVDLGTTGRLGVTSWTASADRSPGAVPLPRPAPDGSSVRVP